MNICTKKAYFNGTVLAGISAGANCWFEQCVTDSIPDKPSMLPCLGIINGSFCPHYDSEAFRRPLLHKLMSEDKIINGYAADDGAAAHFINGELASSVSSRPHAYVYRVSKKEGSVVEEVVETRYLEQ